MKIKEVTNTFGNDFCAIMECEHCGNLHKITSGYNDGYYHNNVIPAMTCRKCGLNRSGDSPTVKNDNGFGHV